MLYRYSKCGSRILLSASKERVRASIKADPPGPTPAQLRRHRLAQQAHAAQNLLLLERPLKPPTRRSL